MKKLLVFILSILLINSVYADDLDVSEYMNKENSWLYLSESNWNYIITLNNKEFIINWIKYNLDEELKSDSKLEKCNLKYFGWPTSNIEFECDKSWYEVSAFKIIENYKCWKEKICKTTLSNLTYSDLYDINNDYTEKNLINESWNYYIKFNWKKYWPYKYIDSHNDSYNIIWNDIYYVADEYVYINWKKITNKFDVIYSSSIKSEYDPIWFSFNLNWKDITIGLWDVIYKKITWKVDSNSYNRFMETPSINFFNSMCYENEEENNNSPEFCTKNWVKLKFSEYDKYFISREGVKYWPYERVSDWVIWNIFGYKKDWKIFVKVIWKETQITAKETKELNKDSDKKTQLSSNQKSLSDAVNKIKAKLTQKQKELVISKINKILESERDKKKVEKLELILLILSL